MIAYYSLPGLKYHPQINRVIAPERIVFIVGYYFGTTITRVANRSRRMGLVMPRQVCVYLLNKHTMLCDREIAELFGYGQHSAARDARTKCEKYIATDDRFRNIVNEIESLI